MIGKESVKGKQKQIYLRRKSIIGGRKSMLQNHLSIGNYQILHPIGMGGFANVKKALHTITGQFVAVKIVNLGKLCENQRRNLGREINIHKTLIHQNIAQIYEVHQDNGHIYIFMELCTQGELFDHINNNGPLSIEEAKKIFYQVHSAVCYLHQHSIAHRDIKTENILLDEHENAKLIDFGLSSYYRPHFQNPLLTTFCGSPSYLSPQMISKKQYDPKMVDVWCLGVTLFAMLKAELPFFHENPEQQKKKISQMRFQKIDDQPTDQLLSQIFLPVSKRITLQNIKYSSFYSPCKIYTTPNFIPIQMQSDVIDEQVIEQISSQMGYEPDQIKLSLKQKKLDYLYGLYYLTLQKNRKNGKQSYYDVKSSIFMKGRNISNISIHKQMERRSSKMTTQRKMKKIFEKEHQKMVKKLFSTPKKKLNIKDQIADNKTQNIFNLPIKLTKSHQLQNKKPNNRGKAYESARRNSEAMDGMTKIVLIEQADTIGCV